MYTWFDYPIPNVNLTTYAFDEVALTNEVIAHIFVHAARQGWDVEHAPLYIGRRVEKWDITLRLALAPPDDVLTKWEERGWKMQPLPNDIRTRLLSLVGFHAHA